MKKVLICFIVFTFDFSLVFSQTHKIDSLYAVLKTEKEDTNKVYILNTICVSFMDMGQYHIADSLANIELQLANKLDYKKGQGCAHSNIGRVCYSISNYPNALKNYFIAESNFEAIGDKEGIGDAYNGIAIVYVYQGNYADAMKNYFSALKIYEEIGIKVGIAAAYGNIGSVYYYQEDYTNALKYDFDALKIEEEIGHEEGVAQEYNEVAVTYEQKRDFANSLKYDSAALKLFEKSKNENGIGDAYSLFGSIYAAEENNENALKNYFIALDIKKELKEENGIAFLYIGIGEVYTWQKQYNMAREYLNKGMQLSKQLGVKDFLRQGYNDIAKLDTITGDYRAAFQDYKMHIVYRDSLENDENTRKLVQSQMNYDFDKKQAEDKAQQDKKDAVSIADKHKQQIVTGAVSLGLLLVVIFSGLLFSRFKVTQKQKMVIEQQKKLVDEKNREVLDSIIYAKRLQDAILPPLSVIKKCLPESFVLYKPKDIVAGDFYWMETVPAPPQPSPLGREKDGTQNKVQSDFPLMGGQRGAVLIAACDCTGHGVPGAMVSVVCSNALNRAVKEFKITEPGKILDKVRELVLETFEKSESDVQDGMDISLASITPAQGVRGAEIQWAGAYNPLWYIPSPKGEGHGEVIELAPNKQPIGKTDNPKPFTTHTLGLNEGDTLYLFTDGYADQFGGPKGKKFKYKTLQEKLLTISSQPMDKQKEELEITLESWKSNLEQVDDILIIGIRV